MYVYMINFDSIPEKIVLFQNEDYEIPHFSGINIEKSEVMNYSDKIDSHQVGKQNVILSTLGGLFKKTVEVSFLPACQVKIGGDAVGIRLYSKGVLVIGKSPIQAMTGEWQEPYQKTNIQKGDKILRVNQQETETIVDLIKALENVEENVLIEYDHKGKRMMETFHVIKCLDDGKNKLGLWVRDGAMGVGTLSFYVPSIGKLCALGHGISDIDVKELIDVDEGFLNLASIASISKGTKGAPGEMRGVLVEEGLIGRIQENTEYGIYGEYLEESNLLRDREEVLVASKKDIVIGPAKMYCTIDNNQKQKAYDINIIKIMNQENAGSKGMIVEVTDPVLLEKTGGIIQGMSGSPIVQNGKLIGAITHVYVNDPTKGYAILAETMISEIMQMEKEI